MLAFGIMAAGILLLFVCLAAGFFALWCLAAAILIRVPAQGTWPLRRKIAAGYVAVAGAAGTALLFNMEESWGWVSAAGVAFVLVFAFLNGNSAARNWLEEHCPEQIKERLKLNGAQERRGDEDVR